MNLSTVKWAQWDKTQSKELLGLLCVHCTVHNCCKHNIAENRPDIFPSYPPDNHHSRHLTTAWVFAGGNMLCDELRSAVASTLSPSTSHQVSVVTLVLNTCIYSKWYGVERKALHYGYTIWSERYSYGVHVIERYVTVLYPGIHFGGINLTRFQPVTAYDISRKMSSCMYSTHME